MSRKVEDSAAIALPIDRPRGAVPSYRGACCPLALPATLSTVVDALGEREGVPRSTVLLAAFKALLARISGQQELVVGLADAGERRVLNTDLGGDPSFRELLKRVATALREEPLDRVLFALGPITGSPGCDLMLSVAEEGAFEYNAELFDAATIRRLRGHFITLLATMVAAPDRRLSACTLLTPPEQQQLVEWRGGITPETPEAPTLHELFAAEAERRPDAVAVISSATGSMSYGKLDARANQLANHLRALGIGREAGPPETVVGIAAERGPELVVGLLGILKAGGVYLPLDP
ncbi:MAG: AMP-binding protein, partial [bacterium]|nr:AMP-binding protein [bacterium]